MILSCTKLIGKTDFFVYSLYMHNGKKSREIILGSGIFLITVGIALICCFALDIRPNMLITLPCLVMLGGALSLFLAYIRKRLVWLFFLGYFLFTSGVFSLVVCFGHFTYSIGELWPVLVVLCGLSYGVSSLQVQHRLSVSSLVPSFVLIGLGAMLLCFSLGLINIPFRRFVAQFWPIFLVLLGIVFIMIYAYMQHSDMTKNSDKEELADSNDDD